MALAARGETYGRSGRNQSSVELRVPVRPQSSIRKGFFEQFVVNNKI